MKSVVSYTHRPTRNSRNFVTFQKNMGQRRHNSQRRQPIPSKRDLLTPTSLEYRRLYGYKGIHDLSQGHVSFLGTPHSLVQTGSKPVCRQSLSLLVSQSVSRRSHSLLVSQPVSRRSPSLLVSQSGPRLSPSHRFWPDQCRSALRNPTK